MMMMMMIAIITSTTTDTSLSSFYVQISAHDQHTFHTSKRFFTGNHPSHHKPQSLTLQTHQIQRKSIYSSTLSHATALSSHEFITPMQVLYGSGALALLEDVNVSGCPAVSDTGCVALLQEYATLAL
jgi:cytochrome b561